MKFFVYSDKKDKLSFSTISYPDADLSQEEQQMLTDAGWLELSEAQFKLIAENKLSWSDDFTTVVVRSAEDVKADAARWAELLAPETPGTEEYALNEIRARRYHECFAVINRGELWYELLTDKQKQELKDWYEAWLQAPETKVIPTKPSWLD